MNSIYLENGIMSAEKAKAVDIDNAKRASGKLKLYRVGYVICCIAGICVYAAGAVMFATGAVMQSSDLIVLTCIGAVLVVESICGLTSTFGFDLHRYLLPGMAVILGAIVGIVLHVHMKSAFGMVLMIGFCMAGILAGFFVYGSGTHRLAMRYCMEKWGVSAKEIAVGDQIKGSVSRSEGLL